MKKVVIIGAGIAGLTCGIYAQLNGFDTRIYESHTIPGGECTGWDRKGYHFDGCISWLTGSKPGSAMHEIWQTTGALSDDVRILHYDVFLRVEDGQRTVNLYTNADKLEEHLLAFSPQDAKEIKKLCKAMRKLGEMSISIDKPMDMMTAGDIFKLMTGNLGKYAMLGRYEKMTMSEYAQCFKDPLLRRAIASTIPGNFSAMSLIVTLAGMHMGDHGVPEGGSRAFAMRMEQKYKSLGGQVFYKNRVSEIIVKDGVATGIRLEDGSEEATDIVISCADAYATLYKLLGNRYTPVHFKKLFEHPEKAKSPTSAIVYMGVDCDLSEIPHGMTIWRDAPVTLGGIELDEIGFRGYGHDKTMAAPGKTVVSAYYIGNYDFWAALDKDAYTREKERLREDAVTELVKRFPQAQGKVEVTDVVTPMTYERYCNAWRGSWMTVESGKDMPRYFPGELEGLKNFILAGMWTLPPGGLPGASVSGRFAAHRITLTEGRTFKTR